MAERRLGVVAPWVLGLVMMLTLPGLCGAQMQKVRISISRHF